MVNSATTQNKDDNIPSRLIDHVPVELEVVLGDARMTVSDLGALDTGTVIELDRQINEAAEIRVNGRVIAHGEVVSVDDKFAVRITKLG